MDVDGWQSRLESTFSEGEVVGPHLLSVIELERRHREYFLSKFHGQSILMDSFQSFFIESLNAAVEWVAAHGWPEGEYYVATLITYLTVFKSFRACENLLLKGYPFAGYALLRDIKDRAVYVCGIAHNLTTWEAIHSLDKSERMENEKEMLNRILRNDSGLPKETLEILGRWEELFHREVHGSNMTLVAEISRLRDSGQISVGPLPSDESLAMYMNRAVETGWLFTRLLSYIQPASKAFGDEWLRCRQILDDSFRYSEQALANMGKPIADAIILLAEQKFSFGEDFCYFESNGNGVIEA